MQSAGEYLVANKTVAGFIPKPLMPLGVEHPNAIDRAFTTANYS